MSILTAIEADLKIIWTDFWQVCKAVFQAEESQLMVDATNLFKAEAIAIQNAQPGLDAKAFIALLIANAMPQLTGDLAGLAYTAISTIASVVAHDFQIPDTTGNTGTLPGGSTT